MLVDQDLQSIQQARQSVQRAREAAHEIRNFSQEQIDAVVAAMASAAEKNAARLAEMAVEETGYGKVADKTIKNLFSSVDVHNYIKGLKTCGVISKNEEKGVTDIAVPVGVVAAVIPTTNPTSTTIYKILISLKGRNTVVVAPHPRAVRCTVETARILAEAAETAGAPRGSVNWLETATLEGTTELMRHRQTNVILATGGPGLVRAAYSSGKPAFGVGSGNVPSFIERSADIPKAVRDVVTGKSFDWGVLCSSEQALICDKPVESQVLEELEKNKAYFLDEPETEKVSRLIQSPEGRFNKDIVGQAPDVLARMAGFSVPSDTTCLVGRAAGVGPDHPLSREKLSPILAFYVEDGWEAGCRRCIEILNYGGLGHTLSIHSRDDRIILEFGLQKPAFRICVNTPSTHGSVGLTTGVPPAMTLGCGSPGGNITSDNITPMHLVNIKRLAYEQRSAGDLEFASAPAPESAAPPPARRAPDDRPPARLAIDRESVRQVVQGIVEKYLDGKKNVSQPTLIRAAAKPSKPSKPAAPDPPKQAPVDFVCEDDVRQALKHDQKIVVHSKTIITPSARDLGVSQNVLLWD